MAKRPAEAVAIAAAVQKMSIPEAAQSLGISRFTVRALIRRRELPHYRIGRRVVIDAGDLAQFAARCRVEAR